jgi:TonB family protein
VPEQSHEAKVEPKPVPKPEPRPEAAVKLPDPAKPAEKPKPEAKAEPKPEPPRAEDRPPKPSPKTPPAKPTAKTAVPPRPEARPRAAGGGGAEDAAGQDAYAAAASRWQTHEGGGGLGGTEGGSGPIGTGGPGPGGGGQVVGLEFIAYQQQVTNTIKGHWTNVIAHVGLVAKVRFQIAPDGAVSEVGLAESSGNAAYDASVLRAVQRANPLPPPPAKYTNEFRDFLIEFHSEEKGGEATG